VNEIHTIDCHYADYSDVACAYLIQEGNRASFVETNTTHAVPRLLDKLSSLGIPKENVDYVIITHVHLDHAGGASALLAACPNATLLAHPKAAKHMIHPARLIESTKAVYGEENFERLYGRIDPIPESRVRVMLDGESLNWGSRSLNFLYTKGHANHHFCIFDSLSGGIFTGDSFGIAYPKMENGGRFIFPTTTPTDFHFEEAIRSLNLILDTGARTAYLTHFGGISELKQQAEYLKVGLELCQKAIVDAKIRLTSDWHQMPKEQSDQEVSGFLKEQVKRMISHLAEKQDVVLTEKDWKLLQLDVELNSQGLLFALQRNRNIEGPNLA